MKNCNCFACKQQKEYESSIIGMYEVPIYKCVNQKEMKTKTIEVKFPTIEGMKVENASVDLRSGVSVVEYVEDVKFKKGDILIREDNWFIIIFDHAGSQTKGERHMAFCSEKYKTVGYPPYDNGKLYDSGCGYIEDYRLATPEEQQILFDALEKEGKYWDSESLEVKELGVNDKIDRILFDLRNCSESVADASEKIRNIIDKEVNKAVNEIYK